MGREARVMAEIGEWSGEGKLQLEMNELQFRGARRLTLDVSTIKKMSIDDGWLVLELEGESARFDLGADFAAKWIHAIENPKSLIDKLDVKATSNVVLAGAFDPGFAGDVRKRAASTHTSATKDHDLIFVLADDPEDLDQIPSFRKAMKSSGAIWVIHPKGRRELSHDAIMTVGKPAGLIDVKSARVSETHAALKLMLPRASR